MAENIPPTSATSGGAPAPNDNATRGLPYYEQLKRNLRETLHKKRILDKNLEALEQKLYRHEQSYLEDTVGGNIIKGFDNYIKGATGTGTTTGPKRKAPVLDADRVFSRSSASFVRDSPAPSSAHTTPSHAPTPTSSFAPHSTQNSNPASIKGTATNNKKQKKGTNKDDEDTEDGGKPLKRYKISYGRD